jgi:hypothetical protein
LTGLLGHISRTFGIHLQDIRIHFSDSWGRFTGQLEYSSSRTIRVYLQDRKGTFPGQLGYSYRTVKVLLYLGYIYRTAKTHFENIWCVCPGDHDKLPRFVGHISRIAEANICDTWSTFLQQLIYRSVGAYLGELLVGTNSWSAGTYFQESGDSFQRYLGLLGYISRTIRVHCGKDGRTWSVQVGHVGKVAAATVYLKVRAQCQDSL